MEYFNSHDRRIDDKAVELPLGSPSAAPAEAGLLSSLERLLKDQLSALEERLLRRVEQLVQQRLEAMDASHKRELAAVHARLNEELARAEERAIDMQATLAELDGDLKRRRRAAFS